MSRVKLITKYFIKSSIDDIFSSKKIKTPIMVMIIFAIIACLSIPLSMMVKYLYEPLSKYNQQGAIILLLLLLGMLIVFLFGIYTIMNIFYFSNDIEHFMPMPFKSSEIITGKFASVYINMIMYSSILILPLVTYGNISNANIAYYLYIIPIILVLPILPMVVSLIICMILMKFTRFFKSKDTLKIIAGCLSLALILVFNILTSGENLEESTIVNALLKGDDSFIYKLSNIIVTNKFLTYSLVDCSSIKGILYLLATIGISIGLFIVFYIIGSKIYLKSLLGLLESNRNREDILNSKNYSAISRSPRRALVFKDVKFIIRTPQLFLSCIAMQLYIPIALIALLVTTGQFNSLKQLITDNNIYDARLLVIVFAAVGLFISVGGAGLTAISRDGKDFAIYKYIPVDYRLQIKTKIVSSVFINELTTVVIGILLLVFQVQSKIVLLGVVISGFTVILVTLFGMYIDLRAPNLYWQDEKELTKGNMLSLLIVIIMIGISFLLFLVTNRVNSVGLIFLLIILIDVFIGTVLYNRVMYLAEKLYSE